MGDRGVGYEIEVNQINPALTKALPLHSIEYWVHILNPGMYG